MCMVVTHSGQLLTNGGQEDCWVNFPLTHSSEVNSVTHSKMGHICHVVVVVLVAQPCLNLCDLMGYSPPGSCVHGILQPRIPEQIAIPFSTYKSQMPQLLLCQFNSPGRTAYDFFLRKCRFLCIEINCLKKTGKTLIF